MSSFSSYKKWIIYVCIALAIGIIIGAFGAHALADKLTPKLANSYETAVRYWFFMHLGMMAICVLGANNNIRFKSLYALTLGTWLFSASIWLYVFSGFNSFAMITPLGGLILVAAWLWTAWEVKNA